MRHSCKFYGGMAVAFAAASMFGTLCADGACITTDLPWTFRSYNDRNTFETNTISGATQYIVVHGSSNECDTAWSAVSGKIPVPADAREFLLSVEVRTPKLIVDQGKCGKGWNNAITWYGADGAKVSAQPMSKMVAMGGTEFRHVQEWGKIPVGAASCTLQFGFDDPNVGPGQEVCYREISMEMLSAERSRRAEFEQRQKDPSWLVDVLYPAPPPRQKVSLRDDGVTLIDGQPFFPIGIYSVCKREFNDKNLDKAFADLKAAGFNFAHTYGNSYNPEFLDAARKHGFKLWVHARMPDRNLLDVGRYNPSIIAWYLGDDTSGHQTPQELCDNNAAVKAVDPFRLTCQADPIGSDRIVSRYAAYVRGTDVFMPEIYPVRRDLGDKSDVQCVAETVRDMKRVASDVRMFGEGRPHGCWPIIQYFKGWGGWDHFPTRDQLFAMTWAAVIHGAHGITWYTYGGFENKKTGKKNEGITSTPERWQAISELATSLRQLSPVLVERTPADQPKVDIVSGPAKDPLGENPSVTVLMKRHSGKTHLFAVNACPEPVTAKVVFADGASKTLELPPFGVHVK